jgi:hypothetical protein
LIIKRGEIVIVTIVTKSKNEVKKGINTKELKVTTSPVLGVNVGIVAQ